MAMSEKMKEKRRKLSDISRNAKAAAENAVGNGASPFILMMNVNKLIETFIYNPEGNLEFKTFKQWKEAGYTIKKGSTAFLFWGQPLKDKYVDEETGEITEEEPDTEKFFPLAYLFSNEQVYRKEAEPQASN